VALRCVDSNSRSVTHELRIGAGRSIVTKRGQRFERDENRTGRQRSAGHAIGHPHRDCGRVLVVVTEPKLATRAYRAAREESDRTGDATDSGP
jgi:hypothetical protein